MKGRTASEIRNALLLQNHDGYDINQLLDEIYTTDHIKRVKLSSEEIKILNEKIKIYNNFRYTKKSTQRLGYALLVFGLVILLISKPDVNDYTPYSIFTISQGLFTLVLYSVSIRTKNYNLFYFVLLVYCLIWIIEIVFLGIPGDLYAGYANKRVILPPSFKIQTAFSGARVFGKVFPILYICLKFLWLFLISLFSYHWYKFSSIPFESIVGLELDNSCNLNK